MTKRYSKNSKVTVRYFKTPELQELYFNKKVSFEDATEQPTANTRDLVFQSDFAKYGFNYYYYASWIGGQYFEMIDTETGEILLDHKAYIYSYQLSTWQCNSNIRLYVHRYKRK